MIRPGRLALKAVNEYRRRDFFAYLALRYLLSTYAARRDRWSREICTKLTLESPHLCYLPVAHFKEKQGDRFAHRDIHLPGPCEVMAETALLDACAEAGGPFSTPSYVFSYRLAPATSTSGIFEPYFNGYRKRQAAIRKVCLANDSCWIRYTDIKKFYPSITTEVAADAWERACKESSIKKNWKDLGRRLLENYAQVPDSKSNGVLTGPMFSHLLANLVFADVDQKMQEKMPGRYFRYVDDVVLFGSKADVTRARAFLQNELEGLCLELHREKKDFLYPAQAEASEGDTYSDGGLSWMAFSGKLKALMVLRPNVADEVRKSLLEEGIRIPFQSFEVATREANYRERLAARLKYSLTQASVIFATTRSMVIEARALRFKYLEELSNAATTVEKKVDQQRKPHISRLRYCAGRLLMLATQSELEEVSIILRRIPELHLHAALCFAVASRDVSEVMAMGTNAVQVISPVLKIEGDEVRCEIEKWGQAEFQSKALLSFHDLRVVSPMSPNLEEIDSSHGEMHFQSPWLHASKELQRLADWTDPDCRSLFESSDAFVREVACLHGVEKGRRHREMIDSVFDFDEQLTFETLESPVRYYS